jgi:hypothetical protein
VGALSVSSQIAACSYGNLTLSPDPDFGTGTEAGTTTLDLNQDIIGEEISPSGFGTGVEGAITTALNDKYGVTSPSELADHVMYCVPPGTGGWFAYAYSSFYSTGTPLPFPPVTPFGWLSVYNDDACLVSGDVYYRQCLFVSIHAFMHVCDESLSSPCLINSICLFLAFPLMIFAVSEWYHT